MPTARTSAPDRSKRVQMTSPVTDTGPPSLAVPAGANRGRYRPIPPGRPPKTGSWRKAGAGSLDRSALGPLSDRVPSHGASIPELASGHQDRVLQDAEHRLERQDEGRASRR